ncbi:hypothetical protein OSH11_19050 [Kaistia dalseonensis]|uniref:Uncharacterized protein n=1 Tax=Kaistia dalseonensis TaxID=410840 RepID=A0ABU0HC49_9HYPH|nr:hypothetical protein [Kaistia dalseonensis]MCX5496812.1 hypothetical protein [Kaistia dalseonensis]MDQ0439438.1 hypothetical protein [Kaistia dalseonensis]
MIKSKLIAAILFGTLALPAVAEAQDYRFEGGRGGYQDNQGYQGGGRGYEGPRGGDYRPARPYPLGPREIVQRLRYQGYRQVDIINQRRDVTIVRAMARGRDLILVVDAFSGDVLRQRVADDGWRGDRVWHGGWGQDWRRW